MAELLTDKEIAREFFTAGYLHALDDVAKRLALPTDAGFLEELRGKVANMKMRAVVTKATGQQA